MSNILILAEPVEGHFNPFVPIIKKLVERGHQVKCLTGRVFKDQVEDLGAAFIPLPAQWDAGHQDVYEFFPALRSLTGLAQIKFYIKHIMYAQILDILAVLDAVLLDFKADVIIGVTFMVAGTWLRELGGPPSVRLSVLPLSLPGKDIAPFGLGLLPGTSFFSRLRNNLLNGLFKHVLFRDVQQHVNELRRSVGLQAYEKDLFTSAIESPDLVLHTSTPAFEYTRAALPGNFRFIGPIVLAPKDSYRPPPWWEEIVHTQNYPVILINQGTLAKDYDDLIRPALEALKDEKVVIIAVPVKDEVQNEIPENVRTAGYIPFGNLLPYVDVMVTNGGFGGVQNALAHGVPLVIAGASEDKMEVAARVEHAGAGINLRTKKPTPEAIRYAVLNVLSDSAYKQHASRLQQDFARYNAPILAVEYVEELIANNPSISPK
jgi:MGT family glycosyltransferase